MVKKYQPTEAELVNDPSLRWNDYHRGEVLEVDWPSGKETFRFIDRDGDWVGIASMTVIERAFAYVHKLTVRRPPFEFKPMTKDEKLAVVAGAHASYGSRHKGDKTMKSRSWRELLGHATDDCVVHGHEIVRKLSGDRYRRLWTFDTDEQAQAAFNRWLIECEPSGADSIPSPPYS